MNKRVLREVVISCMVFLGFVFVMSKLLEHYVPLHTQDTKVVASVENKKIVYVTIDDEPSEDTINILDILDKQKVKAMFLICYENPEYVSLISEEYKKGHAISVHTYSHEYQSIYARSEAYMNDMNTMNVIIKKIGHRVHTMRFPGGTSNTVPRKYTTGIMSKLSKLVLEKGYPYYDGKASNEDEDSYASSSQLVSTAIRKIGEQDEVVSLMHDGASDKATVEALLQILSYIKEKGYVCKVIETSTPVFHRHIAN